MIHNNQLIMLLAGLVLGLFLCTLPATAGGTFPEPPGLPDAFWGNVTLSGYPAPAGSVVSAYIGSVERGSITVTTAGVYGSSKPFEERLIVNGANEEVGCNITFWVNGIKAAQSVAYGGGNALKIDLDADGVRGDLNGDGEVDIGDVAIVAYMVDGKAPRNLGADFNGNGNVDIGDASKIAYFIVGKIGDL